MNRALHRVATVGLIAVLGACRDNTAPEPAPADAALVNLAISSLSVFSITETPKAGRPFEARVNSWGLDSCWVLDKTVMISDESGATITPYNRYTTSATTGCYMAVTAIPHRVTLSFATPGKKTIVVRARDFETRAPLRIELSITVEP